MAATALIALCTYMLWLASADPVVRRLVLRVEAWPGGTPSTRIVLLSDLHVSGPETPPQRIARVVAIVNRLKPDIVLIAGDFVTERRTATRLYSASAAIAPLAALTPSQASIAVLGNHDHWLSSKAVHAALGKAHIRVLDNQAIRIGPLAIGGVDDDYTKHADVARVSTALRKLGGVPILLSHSPDIFPKVSSAIVLTLAGHTHCGQIVLPFIGPVASASRFGRRYICGVVTEGGKRLVVTAGIGASILPFRLGAPPDLWVIDIGAKPPLAPVPYPH